MKQLRLIALILLINVSCNENKETNKNLSFIKVEQIKFNILLDDSLQKPKSKTAGLPVVTKIGKVITLPSNTNVHPAIEPTTTLSGTPRISTPGKDTCLLPNIVSAVDSSFLAGIPQSVIAKDAANKDENPENFSYFNKLQGLKHGIIRCIIEDKYGNLWFGSDGGGVCRYDGKFFTHFTEKEGLSNNVIWCILEDKAGNLWFGTDGGGVSKYDGKSFTHYTTKAGLPSNTIWCLSEDRKGNIWIGTGGGGLTKYDGKKFTNYYYKSGLQNDFIYCMLEDQSGNLWLSTIGNGVSKFNGESFSHYTTKEGLNHDEILCMYQDQKGNIWFGTNGGGACKFDGKSFSTYDVKSGLSNNYVFSIIEDKSGKIWFGTLGGGACRFNGKDFTHFTEKEGLNNNFIRSIKTDKSGNIWFGTNGGGLCKYNGNTFTHFTDKEGLSNNQILSIIEDKSNNLWLGTYGGGICKFDGKSFIHFTEGVLSDGTIYCIYEDKEGKIWFNIGDLGVFYLDGEDIIKYGKKEGFNYGTVISILQDKGGNYWFGTYNGGVIKFDGKTFTNYKKKLNKVNNSILRIIQDKAGNIWMATNGDGLIKYDGKEFTNLTVNDGLSCNNIVSLYEDKTGNLWIGTEGNGVTILNGKSCIKFTEKHGLSNNFILSITEDIQGNIWLGTRVGMNKLDLRKLIELNNKLKTNEVIEEKVYFKKYTYEDGFLGIGCYGNSICNSRNGTIWVGANDRLTAIHPQQISTDTVAPNIQLTGISLFNENIPWLSLEGNKDSTITLGNGVQVTDLGFESLTIPYCLPNDLSLAHNNNFITFNFVGITMSQPQKIKYQYKLEGIDENWSAITMRSEAPYGNLPHGSYTFKVKAMNSSGYWSNPVEYKFTIRPPWWKTWWFRSLIVIAILGLIWIYIKWRERSLVERQKELEVKIDEATSEIILQKELIEEKHKEITDSINYAERIQKSFLATQQHLNENLKDYFILFKPKDVVSGDFYWSATLNNGMFAIATADSTGHGVPGAIMSLLNITSLEKAIETYTEPSDILNCTRDIIIKRLKKDGSADGGKDGMDCSFCVYDFKQMKLYVSAANNPVWIIRKEEVVELKPDKMPVGKHDRQHIPFIRHEIELQKGDIVYTLTDGFPDQFGFENGKKFMSKNLRELLLKNAHLPLTEQKHLLEKTFMNWKGNLEQVDDVTLIGIRI